MKTVLRSSSNGLKPLLKSWPQTPASKYVTSSIILFFHTIPYFIYHIFKWLLSSWSRKSRPKLFIPVSSFQNLRMFHNVMFTDLITYIIYIKLTNLIFLKHVVFLCGQRGVIKNYLLTEASSKKASCPLFWSPESKWPNGKFLLAPRLPGSFCKSSPFSHHAPHLQASRDPWNSLQ